MQKIDIENYLELEGREGRVGEQSVSFTCGTEYPIRYLVTVSVGGRTAVGYGCQRDEYDSAYHEGFEPAYESACRQLGVAPLNC